MNVEEKDAFRRAVYDVVRDIPRGRATTYGAIARAIGYPSHSRLVGHMMAGCEAFCPRHPGTPRGEQCRMPVGQRAFGVADEMQQRLASEGVEVENDRIKHWREVFWNPLDEINL